MRKGLLLSGLMAFLAVAGCLDSGSDSDGSTTQEPAIPSPAEYQIPEVPHVDAAALLEDHHAFVREHNERAGNVPTHESARLALMERFASYGLEVYRHNFTAGIEQSNIIGIKWGHVRDEWVVVGGHYDTTADDCLISQFPVVNVQNPCVLRKLSEGAYDDGSGTMMAVHLGKAFGLANFTPYYTMAFVAYDGEERGLQGASAFVRDFAVEPYNEDGSDKTPYGQVKIHGALDLDMVGINWPGVMAPLNVLTNSQLTYEVANQKRLDMSWPDEQWLRKDGLMLGSSDYAAFWSVSEDEGGPIPTMFFIADFEETGVPNVGGEVPPNAYTPFGVYPWWHLEDTVETMTAMAGGADNLEAGFQAAVDVAAQVLHSFACQPTYTFDAEVY